jgi:NAD+ synthase
MTHTLKILLAQLNPTLGDLKGNGEKARAAFQEAKRQKADLVVFPELFVTGYPPEDLILKPAFQQAAMRTVEELATLTAERGPALLIGTPWLHQGELYNAVALLTGGKVAGLACKRDLPNYAEFDEKRVFRAGPLPEPLTFRGVKIGVPICEDIWSSGDICGHLKSRGAELLLVPNGSPFTLHKRARRNEVAMARIRETGLPLAYVNQVGGQDELVFDGASFVANGDGEPALRLPDFAESLVASRWQRGENGWRCEPGELAAWSEGDAMEYRAVMLGLRDYVDKNGFPGVVLGLSGGIDSALVAAIAADALGPQRVHCLMLPYRYTAPASLDDAAACAKALGVRYDVVAIETPVEAVFGELAPLFAGRTPDTTEENIQSRIRGVILMAASNKFGTMLVTTGNKSEMSVGYCTIYGDMNGGFNPVKDLYKMKVYALARWRNQHVPAGGLGPAGEVIPQDIIDRAPSAELRENQTDQDSLPPYPVLDDILECLVEEEMAVAEIVARGHAEALVRRIEHLLYVAEYKRRQSAPGVKLTSRYFGRDRRYPITNRFRDRG